MGRVILTLSVKYTLHSKHREITDKKIDGKHSSKPARTFMSLIMTLKVLKVNVAPVKIELVIQLVEFGLLLLDST